MRMRSELLIHYMATAICLTSVMLVTTAACFSANGSNKLFFYSGGGSEFLTQNDSTNLVAAEEQLIDEIISQVSEQEIYQTVYDLQSFRTRVYGYPGNTAASTYLYNKFDSISGLNVEYQGGNLRNVIATLPGLDTSSSEIYIAGAHYDSISSDPNNAPGATDDAAGVAIVLEFARIMSQYQFNHTLKFACWNAEEGSHLGSLNYAAYASSHALNIPLYVNLDSPAYDPYDRFVLDVMYNSQSEWASNMLTEHNSLYGIAFTLTYNVHTCGSDHLSFRQYGYAAVMTHTETHGPAHTPDDTIDKVSTLYARKNGQLCMSVLARVAEIFNVEGHNVEVTNVKPSKTVAARGTPISIGVTVRNSGSFPETFTVTTSANAQPLNQTQITLSARASTTFSFPWNTASLPLGSYSITAYASPVLNETDLADNTRTGGNITITIMGDANGDITVNILDCAIVAIAFDTQPTDPNWNPNADLTNDQTVNIVDIVIVATHFGETNP